MLTKQLTECRDQSDELLRKRHQQSDLSYRSALAAFRRAAESDFSQPQALDEAVQQLELAIRMHPRQAEPYAMLAYLMYVFGREPEALACLSTALQFDPGQQIALQVQDLLRQAPGRAQPEARDKPLATPAGPGQNHSRACWKLYRRT